MKWLFKTVRILASAILVTGIVVLVVIVLNNDPVEKPTLDTINVDGIEIKSNKSNRGITYYCYLEEELQKNKMITIGFSLLDMQNEMIYITFENPKAIALVTVSTDYMATLILSEKI